MTSTALPATTDVAIVGAGPTGLALAVTLAEAGLGFVLLDRQAEGANTSRAAVVHARTLEVLDELDPTGALSADLIGRGIPVSRFRIRDGARPLAAIPFDGLRTAHPYALMVPQYETEAVLGAPARPRRGRPPPVRGHRSRPERGRGHPHDGHGRDPARLLRRRRRRNAQQGPRGRRDRLQRQPLRGVLRAGRRRHGLGSGPGRGLPHLRRRRAGRGRTAARGHLPRRRPRRKALPGRRDGRRGPRRAGPRLRAAPAGRARPRPGHRHRPRLVLPVPDPPPGRRPLPRRPAAPRR